MRKTTDLQKLRAALMDLQRGYDNLQKDNQNEKLAAVYFNQFSKEIRKIEDLRRAAMDLQRKFGIEYGYTMNKIVNNMSLNGYTLQK